MQQIFKNQKILLGFFVFFLSFYLVLSHVVFENSKNLQKNLVIIHGKNDTFLSDLSPAVFKIFSFGMWPMVVDWLWMQGLIIDDSLEHVKEGEKAPLFFYADYSSTLDPAFFDAMNYGGLLTMIVRDDYKSAEILLNKGEHFRRNELHKYPKKFQDYFWRESWSVPQHLSYLYLFENINIPNAKEALDAAIKIEGSPEYLKGLAAKFTTTRGQYETAIRIVQQMAERFKEQPKFYNRFMAHLNGLTMGFFLFELNEKFEEFKSNSKNKNKNTEDLLRDFLYLQGLRGVDPEGGRLYVDTNGKIRSTTPREKKGGLPY